MRRFLATLWITTLLAACGSQGDELRDKRVWVYDAEFATRFRLASEGIEKLDDGLRAVAILVQPSVSRLDPCHVRLFLDNEKVSLLSGLESYRSRLYQANVDQFPILAELEGQDEVFDMRQENRSAQTRALAVSEPPTGGFHFYNVSDVQLFERELLPGLAVVEFDLACSGFDPNEGSTTVWLRKDSANELSFKGLVQWRENEAELAYRFSVPERLVRAAWPFMNTAIDYDTPITSLPLVAPFDVPPQ